MTWILILALCAASAVIGRLALTKDEARRTITVRIPAFGLLAVVVVLFGAVLLFLAAIFFIAGSFFGLYSWWLPLARITLEEAYSRLEPVVSGTWAVGEI